MVKPSLVLRIVVTLFFISMLYFLVRDEFPQVRTALLGVKPFFLTFVLLIHFLIMGLISMRLRLFFKAFGLRFSFLEATSLSFIGLFFNNFLPTSMGGDVAKVYYAHKRARRKLASLASVLADRLIGLFSMVCMALVGLLTLWNKEAASIKIAVGLLFLVACLCVCVLFNRRAAKGVRFVFYPLERFGLGGRMKGVYDALHDLHQNRSLLWKSLALSVFAHVLAISSVFLLVKGLSLDLPIFHLFLVFPLITTVSMLPSLGGLGVREGAFVYFLADRLGKGNAVALSILWFGILLFLSFIGGLFYLAHGSISLKELEEVNS